MRTALGVCLVLACLALACAFCAQWGRKAEWQIKLEPSLPTQGGTLKVTYSGALPVTLDLDWDPPGAPRSISIPVGGSATIKVPMSATSLIVSDPRGSANAVTTPIKLL